MAQDNRILKWELREEYMSRELARLSSAIEKQDKRYDDLKQEVNELKLDIRQSIDALALKLVEANTRLKTQTKFSMIMVGALIPANIALLIKVFVG